MTRPTIAEATRYLQSVGLILEPIQFRHYRYCLRRADGMGPIGYHRNFSNAWTAWEMHADSLFRHAAWTTRILDDVRDLTPPERAPLFAWLCDGGKMPEIMARHRADGSRSKRRAMARGWREAIRPWMAVAPINRLYHVPTMPALLREGLKKLAPIESRQWFNDPPIADDRALDGLPIDHEIRLGQITSGGATAHPNP